MGIGGISATKLLILLAIIVLLFGTKRIKNIGEDLGAALKSFRKGFNEASETSLEKNDKQP